MDVGSALNSGLQGINRGLQGAQRNAEAIASFSANSGAGEDGARGINSADVASELVDLKQNELQVKASAKVIESVGESIGSILDVRA